MAKIIATGFSVSRVFLLDRSQIQLEIATGQPNLHNALPIQCDLMNYNWFKHIPSHNCQRILISVFAIQELPALASLLFGLESLVLPGDVILLLTVDPEFSETLLQNGNILEYVKGSIYDDWHWRGLYPIDGAAGRLYLPHFQRTVDDYLLALNKHGFDCVGTHYLAVPSDKTASSVYSNTVYGNLIIGKPSSVILVVQKQDISI